MIAISSEAYNASSNMTLQENDKLPLVKRVTQTLLNITNLLRCVHYRHHVSVLYPGLGETEQKVYEDTSMLRKTEARYVHMYIHCVHYNSVLPAIIIISSPV